MDSKDPKETSTRTSAEVDADYKNRVPKFDEKVDVCETDDILGIKLKRKPFVVRNLVLCIK